MTKSNGLRGVVLLVVLAGLLAGCTATNPRITEVYLSDGVTVELGVDSCNATLDATVVESDSAVQVTITAENDTADDCADSLIIVLDQPLGDRLLVDGATGQVLSVRSGD